MYIHILLTSSQCDNNESWCSCGVAYTVKIVRGNEELSLSSVRRVQRPPIFQLISKWWYLATFST